MRIILSPAKKMREDRDSFPVRELPRFLPEAEQLYYRLRDMSDGELKSLWKCNDRIAELNLERLRTMDLRRNLTPAILSYDGIQYQHMAPGVFTVQELKYVQEHLRILSGFYGILRPLDGVTPYRLEMQARLDICEAKNLYEYWNRRIFDSLREETDCIVNLASKEYSRCVSDWLSGDVRFITCVFGERKNGKIVEKGTMCKMARGEMVRYMAEHQIRQPERMRGFACLGYRYAPEASNENTFTFIKEDKRDVGSRNESA